MSSIAVATLLAVIASKSPAGFSDAGRLLADCGDSRQFVSGYVIGWLDKWSRDELVARRGIAESIPNARAMTNWAYFGDSVGVNMCIPPQIDAAKISDMLCDFLNRNSTLKDVPAEEVMSTFAGLNFLCDTK
ncbi:hypothetical protein [Rhizobium sp. BR 314]|uniref:hypothetical protein n=1 Tax=Rhizobium sp. BR 314 TaxID=3040013 RepID=UPI0039BF04A7